jgi:hypothetical protein
VAENMPGQLLIGCYLEHGLFRSQQEAHWPCQSLIQLTQHAAVSDNLKFATATAVAAAPRPLTLQPGSREGHTYTECPYLYAEMTSVSSLPYMPLKNRARR